MRKITRTPLSLALLGLALLVLSACGAQTSPAETMNITHVDGSATADSLTYEIETSGYGVEGSGTVTYVFECERFPDGTSVLTVTTGDGELVATATRAPNGAVTLETSSGFTASGDGGTLVISEAERERLSLVEWALLDASIFSWYEMPSDAPDEANLLAWRNDLTLIESVQPATKEQSVASQFWEDAFTNFSFFGSGDLVQINITCIPF